MTVPVRIFLVAMLFFASKGGLMSQTNQEQKVGMLCWSTAASWTDPDGKASTTP
jgi:hypothetical protein